jgi:hypothetical protein
MNLKLTYDLLHVILFSRKPYYVVPMGHNTVS